MAYLDQTVTIDGHAAELTEFGDFFASIKLLNRPHNFLPGTPLQFTVIMNLMEKQVPLTLKGEVVQPHDSRIDVMYAAPTRNWVQILRNLKRHNLLF